MRNTYHQQRRPGQAALLLLAGLPRKMHQLLMDIWGQIGVIKVNPQHKKKLRAELWRIANALN